MLTRIEIDGFKSFTNFSMEFSPLTVIAGLNASGKSNLFDALHLLSLLAEHDLNTAFDKVQRGSNLELFTQYADGRYAEEMRFVVDMVLDGETEIMNKTPRYELVIQRKTNEFGGYNLTVSKEVRGTVFSLEIAELMKAYQIENTSQLEGAYWTENALMAFDITEPDWPLTTIAATKRYASESAPDDLKKIQKEMAAWKIFRLDPSKIASHTSNQSFGLPHTLNAAADNLAGVLWRLSKTDSYLLTRIAQRLASLVPGIKEIVVKHDDYYNQYRMFVHTTSGQRFAPHLLSEGTLRLLALCVLAFDDKQHGVLGLEEPENGVHPGLLKRVAELLRDLSTNEPVAEGEAPWPLRQVIVNTHSPGLIKACLEAAAADAGTADGKPALTVWFSQLVGRPVEEDGKRVLRRVTDMLPVVLPKIQPSEAATAGLSEAERRVSLAQLLRYLETTPADPLLSGLGYPDPTPPLA